MHRIAAGLDLAGRPVAWLQRIVGQSIFKGTPFEGMMREGIDPTSVEGTANLPYAIPHLQVELHTVDVGVAVLDGLWPFLLFQRERETGQRSMVADH